MVPPRYFVITVSRYSPGTTRPLPPPTSWRRSRAIRSADPEFESRQHAFYYARVIENPTCRWSTWDAVRAQVPPNPKLPATIQERAYTSPIWFVPTKNAD
jgi:hypothetical protein